VGVQLAQTRVLAGRARSSQSLENPIQADAKHDGDAELAAAHYPSDVCLEAVPGANATP
jgi:hypothetical protein